MSRITELSPIQGTRTRTEDLFVVVNTETGDLGTRNITRKELVNSIQLEDFDDIKVIGGSISGTTVSSSLINSSIINNPTVNSGTFLNINVSANSTITTSTLSDVTISESDINDVNISNSVISDTNADNITISNSDLNSSNISDPTINNGSANNLQLIDPEFDFTGFYESPLGNDDYFVIKNVNTNQTVKIAFSSLQDEIAQTFQKVSKLYVDANATVSGNGSYYKPFNSLEEAFEAIEKSPKPASISVLPGEYFTNGNLPLPDDCSIVSTNGQYSTTINIKPGFEEENCFLVGSGCYVQGFAFRNQRIDNLDNPSKGFGVAFRPGAIILRSPYIRDCSQISNYTREAVAAPLDPVNANPLVGRGGGVILADRAVLNQNSIFPYMLAFGATPRSPNGVGYVAKNGAGINGIGSITIFQRTAFYALNGGQVTLNNSGTQFGDISMRSNGSTPVVEPYETTVTTVKNESLANEIFEDADTITNDMWEFLTSANTNYQGFDGAKCKRDVGLILEGVTNDLVLGTNYWSIVNGLSYRRQASSVVIDEQLTETAGAIEFLRDETVKIIESSNTNVQIVTDSFDEIVDILINGSGSADALVFSNTEITEHASARDQLQTNRSFIIDELISWISSEYPSFAYDESICRRDTGYIIDAISHDINYDTNIATILNAQSYFTGSSSQLPSDQRAPTAAAISRLGVICADVVVGTYPNQTLTDPIATSNESSKAISLANKIATVVLENSLSSLPVHPTPFDRSWIDDDLLVDRSRILLFKDVLKTKTLKFIGSEYSLIDETLTKRDAGFLLRSVTFDLLSGTQTGTRNFIAGFFDYKGDRVFEPTNLYSYEKCHRDLKLIIEAVAYDMAFGSNFRTITAAKAYYRANAANVLSAPQRQLTIDTFNEAKSRVIEELSDGTSISRVDSLFDIIIDVFQNGVANIPALVIPDPTGYDDGFFNARRLLLDNKTFILDEIDAWIVVNFPDLVYDTAKCRRDVGLIVDALRYDLTYGGNLETLVAANSYFAGVVAQYGEGEKLPTIGAFERLRDILGDVLAGIAITPSSGNTTTQDVSGTPGTQEAAEFAQARVGNIITVIQTDGITIPSRLLPSLDWIASNFRDSFILLDNNNTILANDVLEEINKIGKTLLGAFLESYDFIRDYIIQNYVLTTQEEVMIIALFDDIIKKTLLGPSRLRFGSLIESIGHQFNLAGAGVNKNALPLNFRRVGKPLPASGSVLQQNGGRVRWSGADELNNQYFAKGLKINGRTGRLEGRPFTSSVRRLARRAANSRTFT